MSISPPSDIVVDVLRAADPGKAAAVARRLSALEGPSYESVAQSVAAEGVVAAATPADAPIPPAAPSSRLDQAARQLDSVFLNEMLSHMTPDPSSRPDGSFAGGMWQSLLIQNVADQISKSGRFSLSRHLFNPGGTAHASADVAARTGSVWRVNDEKSI